MQTKGKIGVTTENIFPIIKKFLYSEHDIFLRELVSNAVDATQKLKTLSSLGEFKGEMGELKVNIEINPEDKSISIIDRGIGMTADEVEKYINQIAFSGAEEFLAKYKDTNAIIGHFGLGFYSSFMVAKNVEIETLSFREGAKAVKWSCDGSPEFTLEEIEKEDRGTKITLYLDEESTEFAQKERVGGLLEKYCRFLPIPIIFGKEQKWEDGKYVDTDIDNVINDTNPLWTAQPSDITEAEYKDFYSKLYPMSEEPLFHIHLNVDYPFNLTGILYFPKLKNHFEFQRNKIQLYSNQVFVTDSVDGIVPEFLTLLHGVIDSPDIPLNVSRSYLQGDPNVRKISSHITKKVADRLQQIFDENRDDFEKKWNDLKIFIQYGVVSDEKFAEKAENFLLMMNEDNKYFTITEYQEKVRENQTDKDNNIIFLYSNDLEVQHSFIEVAKAKGYDVLLLNSPLESHFISWAEHKHENIKFVRVDSDVVENLIRKESETAILLTTEQQDTLRPVFESALPSNDKVNYSVSFAPMSSDDAPISITQNEFMRRMRDMAAVGGNNSPYSFYGEMPHSYNVAINGNHPLVVEVLGDVESSVGSEIKGYNQKIESLTAQQDSFKEVIKDKKDDELSEEEKSMRDELINKIAKVKHDKQTLLKRSGKDNKTVSQLVDLALLSNGMLKGESLTNFIKRSVELIAK